MIDISPADEMIVNAILKKHVAKCEVRAFGSRHKWTAKSYSDLDLAIVGAAKLDKSVIYALQEAFEESELSFRVDVLDWYAISDEFRQIIEQGYSVIQEKEIDNQLPAGWMSRKLGEHCKKIASGATPTGGNDAYQKVGISLIRSQNIHDFTFSYNGLAFINEQQANKLKNVEVQQNDVLLNITGDSVARCCSVPCGILPARVNQHVMIIRPDERIFNAKFLQYYLLNRATKEYLLSIAASGATRNALTKGHIENLDIIAPSIEEQKKIAAILLSLDDKIELNRQTNQTLEEIAQTLFKEWFIDFNFPDENGNPYRDSGGSMIDSELGKIPASWSVGYFNNLISDTLGGDWGKDIEQGNYNQEVLCIRGADIKELKTGSQSNTPIRYILEKNLKNKNLFAHDIVIEISGGSPTQSTGRTLFITDELLNQFKTPLICTNFCRRLRFNVSHCSLFCYLYLNYLYDNDIFFNYENGTTGVKNLDTASLFSKHSIIMPSDNTLKVFHKNIINLMDGIYTCGKEINKLTLVRDALLPKLMSGILGS